MLLPNTAAKSLGAMVRMKRWSKALLRAFDALVTGSRTIPMGDNGALLRELGKRSGRA